ncbi:MAG: hypothetical protein HYS13_14270 [Planctomycetia bacterium]|nr:hypothetical protein [Planctomycetia bacterium]
MHGLAQFHSGNSLPTLPEILTAVFLSVFAAQVWCFHVRMLDDARVLDGPKRCAFLVAVPCAYLGGLAGAAIVFAIPFSAVTNPEYLQWLVPVGAVLIVILACLRRTVVWVARPTLPSKGAPDEHLAS